ncbi:hypothetical protein [Algivirga pacifica]|uniref:Lipocalin-like domain-containing protein n=1 Tax=Algivirga pacifica TaxID=1162670 RepID=A0ABP9CXR9_9BACT
MKKYLFLMMILCLILGCEETSPSSESTENTTLLTSRKWTVTRVELNTGNGWTDYTENCDLSIEERYLEEGSWERIQHSTRCTAIHLVASGQWTLEADQQTISFYYQGNNYPHQVKIVGLDEEQLVIEEEASQVNNARLRTYFQAIKVP